MTQITTPVHLNFTNTPRFMGAMDAGNMGELERSVMHITLNPSCDATDASVRIIVASIRVPEALMTLFVGGPYDGKDLPFDPYKIKRIPLPPGEQPTASEDLTQTADEDWNCIYNADVSTSPPVYRYQPSD